MTNQPRIVQVLDGGSAIEILSLCGVKARLAGPVVLDDDGNLWRYGLADIDGLHRDWHRLPLPPLPETGQARAAK